jgi:hypothetical protein
MKGSYRRNLAAIVMRRLPFSVRRSGVQNGQRLLKVKSESLTTEEDGQSLKG